MGPADAAQAALIATARALEIDRVTAVTAQRLEDAGVPTVLIKGPTVAEWLYDDGVTRTYVDSDLLVQPARFEDARAVLGELGFEAEPIDPAELPDHGIPHAEPFRHPEGAAVDLHRVPSGASLAPSTAWEVLSRHLEPMSVGGVTVSVPTLPVRALLCAFHAAQHGPDEPKPAEDLRRAIERAPEAVWHEAAAIAAELGGIPALARGLRGSPAGDALADRLGLPSAAMVEAALDARSHARVAVGFERLAGAQGARAKIAMALREAFPTPEFMRWWKPIARRGPLGLATAYLVRIGWLARNAGPSFVLWRRQRAASRQP